MPFSSPCDSPLDAADTLGNLPAEYIGVEDVTPDRVMTASNSSPDKRSDIREQQSWRLAARNPAYRFAHTATFSPL
jgi:hypothetical protein